MQKSLLFIWLLFIAINAIQAQKQNDRIDMSDEKIFQRIDSLDNAGLPQSALKLTNELYQKAFSQKNTTLLIKTLVLRMKYREDITEESLVVFVDELEQQVTKSWEPAKQIMHSMIAELYQWYYNQNQWKILEQRKFDTGSGDIREMSASELSAKAIEHYCLSLENVTFLQNERLDKYKYILDPESGKFDLRPALYDLMANRAVEALLSDRLFQKAGSGDPAFDNSALLGDIEQFLKISFVASQKDNAVLHGLTILQDWLAFRMKADEPAPLYDADLIRLKLLSGYYSGDNMEGLYENSLTDLANKSVRTSLFSSVLYEKARFLQQLGNSEAGRGNDRNYLKESLAIAQQGINSWPKSEGAALCRNLIEEINKPSLQLQTEGYTTIGERFVYRVGYNNVKQIYANLFYIENDETGLNRYDRNLKNITNKLKDLKPVVSEVKMLPVYGDYLDHSAELGIKVPNKPGNFCLVISHKPLNSDFKKMEIYCLNMFQVTNLAVLHRITNDGYLNVTVANRVTGEPVKDVELSIFGYERYDRKSTLLNVLKTDENGRARLKLSNSNSVRIVAVSGNDSYQSDQIWIGQYNLRENDPYKRAYLFTDRKIYRPGQTVFFKAILMESDDKEAKVLKQQSVKISLCDVNNQEVSSQTIMTNEYGSVNGKFSIPSNVLTGNFYLRTDNGGCEINVENYKRPRFEILMNPFEDIVLLGEKVKTTGRVTDLTGAPLQGASVSWRVTRRRMFWRSGNSVSLTSGVATTGSNGEFEILFTAVPSSKNNMEFSDNFVVEVDVTDVNGETRSQTQIISIGEDGVYPALDLDNNGFIASVKKLPVTVTLSNRSGNNVKGSVKYSVCRLLTPQTILPQSLWNRPDTVLYNEAVYSKAGPGDEEWKSWPVSDVIKSGEAVINGKKIIDINFNNDLPAGVYKVIIETPDKNGKIREASSVFYICGTTDQSLNPGQGLLITVSDKKIITGKNIEISLASAFKSGRAFLIISQGDKIFLERDIPLNRISEKIILPVTTDMEGSIYIHTLLVQNNRVYKNYQIVEVINPARKLNLQFQSFRDKVRPGSNETWSVKVTDGNNQPSRVEMLALMYDSALDYYSSNSLVFNPITLRYGADSWMYDGFDESIGWNRNSIRYKDVQPISYPSLYWFGYRYGWGFGGGRRLTSKALLKTGSVSVLNIVDDDVEISDELRITDEFEESDKEAVFMMVPPDAEYRSDKKSTPAEPVDMVRRQLQETALFMPMLESDDKGEIMFSFTMPESVTKWRFMALAHRQDGVSGTMEQYITSSRELMVMPNLPRIVREGDELIISTKIINTTGSLLTGSAFFNIKDAVTGSSVNDMSPAPVSWSAEANGITTASWSVKIPYGIKGLLVTISAASDKFQDGEEHLVPVLPVKMIVTETMPVTLSGKGKHHVKMESLVNSKKKEHNAFTFTYTQNAAWEMLGVLPWLIERPYESVDQVFNRYFAVSVAKKIFKENPQIERVIKAWAAELPGDKDALLSALERNPELKNTLLSATPWLTDAKDDTERRRRLASLVADGFLDAEQNSAFAQLEKLQMDNGAWPWYSGMPASDFVTSDIVAGFGYLKKITALPDNNDNRSLEMAVRWLKEQLILSRENAIKNIEDNDHSDKDTIIVPDWNDIKEMYALSFFVPEELSDIEQFWLEKIRNHYKPSDVTGQSIVALILSRYCHKVEARQILASVKEKTIQGERGEYFFKSVAGPFWYNSPVERQVIVLEALREIEPDNGMIDGLEDWLISQKRTQHWQTTRATLSAVYGLASSQRTLFANQEPDQIKVGGQKLKPAESVSGSGYFSQSWNSGEVKPALGNVEVIKGAAAPSFASLHWSYIEEEADVEKGGFIDVNKALFKRVLKDGAEEWYPVTDSVRFNTGDRLMVRLIVETSQALDFVYINDKRASVLEPLDLFSGYVWKSGLGYYASITDAGADFFIDHLPKGKFSLTYELVVSHKGVASSGPAVVQCFYAPEFSGHSKGSVLSTK